MEVEFATDVASVRMNYERMPEAPGGYACCRVWNGATRTEISHLVVHNSRGFVGPTLCGLTRFDERDPATHAVTRKADLPGWSMNGGTSGPGVGQAKCEVCWGQIDGYPESVELGPDDQVFICGEQIDEAEDD